MLRKIKATIAAIWYKLLARFPLPAQNKWEGVTDLLAQIPLASLEEEEGREAIEEALDGSLEKAGARWMWRRSEWLAGSAVPNSAASDLLVVAFKTLDMATRIKTNGNSIKATTYHCPFIERTRRGESVAKRICQGMCSEHHSLFKGLTHGLPIAMSYEAPRKMGWGDDHCIKEFRLLDGSDE